MNLVLDASVTLAWAFRDERSEYAVGVLRDLESASAIVPGLWPLEVTNGLWVAERRDRISSLEVTRFFSLVLALPIAVDPVERRRAFETTHRLARTRGLSTYDASYLELAVRMGLPLATLDGRLREAAEAEGVGVYATGG